MLSTYHCIGDSHTWQFIGKLPENLNNNKIATSFIKI